MIPPPATPPATGQASGRPQVRPGNAPLHPLEAALVGITALHLSLLPWALGTMHLWSQLASLGCSSAGFILALLPRPGTAGPQPAGRLRRFPVFWAGLALLGYIAIQGLNPAWRFASNTGSWWIEPVAHIPWLPSGIAAPVERSSPWRALAVDASLWLLLCSVWTGFSRRRSYRALFTCLGVNALLLALLGLLQKWIGATRIFGRYLPANDSFFASFIYPNHAGPYFNLMVALCAGLAWWYYQRARHRLEHPALAVLFALIAAFAGLAVVLSYSRMSIVLLLVFLVLLTCALGSRLGRRTRVAGARRDLLPVAVALACFLLIGLVALQSDRVRARFAGLVAAPAASVLDRALVRAATRDMFRDNWLLGWGAGGFRYGFPAYARGYPAISYAPNGDRFYWEHAHDDLLEIPVELGAAGLVPVVLGAGGVAWLLIRRRFWRNALSLTLVLGGLLVLVHGWVDFVFQNPAVLLTWAVLLAAAARWAELDQPLAPLPVPPRSGREPGGGDVPGAGSPTPVP